MQQTCSNFLVLYLKPPTIRPMSLQQHLLSSLILVLLLFGWSCAPAAESPPLESQPTRTATERSTLASTSSASPTVMKTPAAETALPVTTESMNLPTTITQPRFAEIPGDLPDYDRGDWSHWSDEDRDCQNTRAEVLIMESLGPISFRHSKTCTVDRGRWFGAYTGQTVTEASKLDVDHMVPLKNAHLSGGWSWDAARKKAYANDLHNDEHLIAVTAGANRSKSANGPESWRPERSEYWCEYATNWIIIKNRWDLSVTSVEWSALLQMLETCGTSSPSIIPSGATPLTPSSTPTERVTSGRIGPRTGSPLLYDPLGPDRNCIDFPSWAHAQDFYEAAGGNNAHGLDRDRDGIACQGLPGGP
ncbi:MAG: hypothetical protein CL778_02795 [Chloroflexi bacterium]|nr:hypothetical protein [Chloroflexota bacterium]